MNTNSNNQAQASAEPSESLKTPQPIMPKPLQPHFCVQRDDNTVVPLIAIDELPESVILKGVPIKLTVLDALKAHMTLTNGEYPAHGVRYQLDRPLDTQVDASEQGYCSASDGSPTSDGSASSTQKGRASDKKGNKNMKDKALKHPTLTTNGKSIIDPLAKKGTMGKKVYCTYWIQTGNCNYMQEGCKYKHEIPKDEETRRAIGFREFPNWPREEMPARPLTALHKPWRRQDGKHESPGAPGPSNRGVVAPTTVYGTPNTMARGNGQPLADVSPQAVANNAHYYPNVTAFAAPQQHFPTHASHTTQQRLPTPTQGGQSFLGNAGSENHQQRPSQNNASPPAYNQPGSQTMNGGRLDSTTPPKQPPISRPSNLGQSPVNHQQHNMGASVRRVAPDYHILGRASGLSGADTSAMTGNLVPMHARPVYSGMHNNWNPHTNAPTSMDISFIAPSPESTRSGSQALYTPNFTSSNASATPTLNNNNNNTFGSNTKADSRAGTPAHHSNNNAFINNGKAPMKGRGPVQYGRNSPAPSTGSARNPVPTPTIAEESDATSVTSPPVQHRVFFREPGQPEFVTNPPEPKATKSAHGMRKHGRKAHAKETKSAKSKMNGNGYDVLVDAHDQQ